MTTSKARLCGAVSLGQDCMKTETPSFTFPPKRTNVPLSPLSALNYTFSNVKYLFRQHSQSNANGWSSITIQQQRKLSIQQWTVNTQEAALKLQGGKVKHTCHSQCMFPWVLSPQKLVSDKLSHSEERDEEDSVGLCHSESTTEVPSGKTGRAVPFTSKALPSAALSLNKLDWESLALSDIPFSKPHRQGVVQADQLTCQLLVSPASYLPWQIKSALSPAKCRGCQAAHHLHLLEWRGTRCRGSGQQKQPANCTLGCPVLG